MKDNNIRVSVVGGSGYAGGELIRLLLNHPKVAIVQVTSRSFAGEPVSIAHPNLRKVSNLTFTTPADIDECDLLFVALPNGISMKYMEDYKKKADRIIDLGADFRLHDGANFQKWYLKEHSQPQLLADFVYGIAELHREKIKTARYVACGGCEATVSILSLYPLIKHRLISEKIIIDAKMSSSQAGLNASLSTHHPERAGVVRSYMPTGHRHTAEILQELSVFGYENLDIAISATALDIVRGLLVTIHTVPLEHVTEKEIWKAYRSEYSHEPFIRIVKDKRGLYRYPEPKILQGSNFCDIGFELDSHSKRLVVIGAVDNLMKGTAGQAVQAMNLMYGFDETLSLEFSGLHPV